MARGEESEAVTEPPAVPPRFGKGSATEATVDELLSALHDDSTDTDE